MISNFFKIFSIEKVRHLRRFLEFRFTMGFVDNIIAKCNIDR